MEAGVWEFTNSPDGMTMAFLTMSMAEIFHSFNMRSQRGTLFRMKKKNLFLLGSMAFSWILTTIIIYVPFLAKISLAEYGVALLLAISIIPIVEIVKLIQRWGKRNRDSSK